jgi:hypothetical protein
MNLKNSLLWSVYIVFAGIAFYTGWSDRIFSFSGPLASVKALIWVIYLSFLAFTIFCSTKEDLLRSLFKMAELHWGRQVGMDLYIGLTLMTLMIYLHSGSWLVVLAWVVPLLLYVNLATLLYVVIYFDSIVAKFMN